MATAYVVVDNDVLEPEAYREYLDRITPTVPAYGGRYVIRAGRVHLTDSDWYPERLVVIAFDSVEQARAWVESDAMVPVHALRRRSARSKLIVIEGVADPLSGANA